jgi:hypothetical protein
MDAHLYCFNDEQRVKIAPHLPANQTGSERKDDRLILRGIMQGHCHIEKVETVFNRGEARLRHWNRVAWLSPGRQYKQVKTANGTEPYRFARGGEPPNSSS